jgi:hypothetical protein
MTHKEFVPYAEALALKELHFDEPCLGIHYNEGLNPSFMMATQYGEHGAAANGGILAPLYQQAFKFFRDKYNLNYVIVKAESWFYTINGCNTQEGFNTYEEAELACLAKLIEIAKEQKQKKTSV